jgi:hypothetical protein
MEGHMFVVSTEVEVLDDDRIRVTTVLGGAAGPEPESSSGAIGEGPTRDTVPDRAVRFLIGCGPEGAQMNEIQRHIGGNSNTANRQVWTLGSDSPDVPARLRGWVRRVTKGRYSLTDEAWELLKQPSWRLFAEREAQAQLTGALRAVVDGVPPAVLLADGWRDAIESGGNVGAARAASDESLFAMLATSKRANSLFGRITDWEMTERTWPLIQKLELMGQNYRRAIHAPTPSQRGEVLEYLGERAAEALELVPGSFEDT